MGSGFCFTASPIFICMTIDIIALVVLAIAVWKGLQKGLIVGLFSFIGIFVGAAAALKLSGMAGQYLLAHFPNLGPWVPLLSFILVFAGVVFLVRIIAAFIEKTLEWSMMGWANKLGGILFFTLLYALLFSIALFYADEMALLSADTKQASVAYSMLQPMAPVLMDGIGKLIPVFKDLFGELEAAFDGLTTPAQKPA